MILNKLPLAIEIEINSSCNLACSYCPNSKFERVEKGHMKLELYEKIMSQLQRHSYSGRVSYHFYNEPTLSPNLEKFVALTKAYLPKAKTNLFSNGTLLNEEKVNRLQAVGIDKFSVTEHEKTHLKKIRKIQTTLGSACGDNFRLVNFQELPLTNRGGALPEVGRQMDLPASEPCLIPHCVLIITVLGNVVPCYEDYFQKNVMGNVNDQDIIEIWNSPRYVKFRQDLKKGERSRYEACRDCNNYLIIN